MVWTFPELEARIAAYGQATRRRDWALVAALLALLGGAAAAGLWAGSRLAVPVLVVGLLGLAGYMVASARAWHRRHGVLCPSCGLALAAHEAVHRRLDEAAVGPAPPLRCPECGAVIAEAAA